MGHFLAVASLGSALPLASPLAPAAAEPTTVQTPSPAPSPEQGPEVVPSAAPPSVPSPSGRVDGPAAVDDKSTAALPADWSQLFSGLVATFVGAFLALWTSVWLERKGRRRARKGEKAAHNERLRSTLDLIGHELEWNGNEVVAIMADLESRLRTERAPKTHAWTAVGIEAMKEGAGAAASLSDAYALLARCQRLLDQYATDVAQGGASMLTARKQTLPRLRALVAETAASIAIAREQLAQRRSAIT